MATASPLADAFALRASEMHQVLADTVPDFASRGLPDLREAISVKPAMNEVGFHWLPCSPGQTEATLVIYAREKTSEPVAITLRATVTAVLATYRELQDYVASDTPSEVCVTYALPLLRPT